MVKRIGGLRRKTRQIFKKNYRQKGKISLSKYYQTFEVGSKVVLKAEPAHTKGIYKGRFHGKIGVIKGKQGKCYKVAIRDGKKEKVIITYPIHLKKV